MGFALILVASDIQCKEMRIPTSMPEKVIVFPFSRVCFMDSINRIDIQAE
jgi:hypothetical protein